MAFPLLQIALTALHLLAVNIAAAGPLLALWCLLDAKRRHSDAALLLGRQLLRAALAGMLLGALLGGGSLGLEYLQRESGASEAWFAAAARVPRERYLWTAVEWCFSLVLFKIADWLWPASAAAPRRWGWIALVLVVSSTNLAYHFPTMFAALAAMSVRPNDGEPIVFTRMIADHEVQARVLHFLLAATAAAGVLQAYLATQIVGQTADEEQQRLARRGMRVALTATGLQWIVGVWLLTQLGTSAREAMMGAAQGATLLLAISLGLAAWLTNVLAHAAFDDVQRSDVRKAATALGLAVLLMTAARHFAGAG